MNSPDFSSIISGILSKPEMLSGIINAVSTISSSLPSAPAPESEKPHKKDDQLKNEVAPAEEIAEAIPSAAMLGSLFAPSNADSEPQKDKRNGDSIHHMPDNRRALLYALKPYLGDKRQDKIDFILKVLTLLEAAESFNKIKH